MTVQAVSDTTSIRTAVSPEEWETRVELAAAHRIMAHFGIQDLTHNHLTARVPGEADHFLIKAADAMFDEVSASNLVKYDLDGNPQQDGYPQLRGGGLIIHAGLFAARDDLNVLFHTHTPSIIGVASQKNGLLPIILSDEDVERLAGLADQPPAQVHIDLEAGTVTAGGETVTFFLDPHVKHSLLNGLDDIDMTLESEPDIASFETTRPGFKPSLA